LAELPSIHGITAVLWLKYAGLPWGWGPVLQYYCGYGVEFSHVHVHDNSRMHVQGRMYIISFTMQIVHYYV